MTTESTLASLIGSRICHDLISPIGAINNGLELLTMSGDSTGPEIDLIGESVGHAAARIRFFRIAFGSAGDQMIGPPEISDILSGLYAGGRLQVLWEPTAPQPRSAVRLAFLALLCAEVALPLGGTITVSAEGDRWTVSGAADRVALEPALQAQLTGAAPVPEREALQPSQVQFGLLPAAAREDNRTLALEMTEGAIALRF